MLIHSADLLQDVYVNKNSAVSKDWRGIWEFWSLMSQSILFQQTDHPNYVDKRKALSGAFFKSKLLGMTKIIKEVTLKEIKHI